MRNHRMKFSQIFLAASCIVVLATTQSIRQPGERPLELALNTLPTRCSTRAGAATEGAPGAATREQTPGSSLATTTPLATAWSDSLEDLELPLSPTVSLETHVVKSYMY